MNDTQQLLCSTVFTVPEHHRPDGYVSELLQMGFELSDIEEAIAQTEIIITSEDEQKHREHCRKGIADLRAEYPEDWQRERRKEYAESRAHEQDVMLKRMRSNNLPWGFIKTMWDYYGGAKWHKMASFLSRPAEAAKGGITELDIQRAREYPITDLIDSKKGWALCPFHDDTRASFYIGKKNFGYCFSCNESADSPKLAMHLWHCNFVEAVKRLGGR